MYSRNKIAINIFLGTFFIWLIYMSLYITTNFKMFLGGSWGPRVIASVAILLLFSKELISIKTNSYNSNFYAKTILLIVFVVSSVSFIVHNDGLISLSAILLVISSRNINIFSTLKIFTIAESIVLFLSIISSKIGLIQTLYMPSDDGLIRNSLGFSYVSFASHHAFFLICAYLILRRNQVKYIEYIFILIIILYLYRVTATSSPFYLSLLAVFYDFLVVKIVKEDIIINNNVLKVVAILSFAIAFVIIIYFCSFASPDVVAVIDRLVHNRLHLSIDGIRNFGVTAFGQKVSFITLDIFGRYSGQYNYIDSSYVQSLVVNGWIFTFILIFLYCLATKWAIKQKYEIMTAFMVLASIQAMFDPQMFVLWYSPFVMILGKCFSMGDLAVNEESNEKI